MKAKIFGLFLCLLGPAGISAQVSTPPAYPLFASPADLHFHAREEFYDLMKKDDYAAIDALVAALIAEKRKLPDGDWQLSDMGGLVLHHDGIDPEEKIGGRPSLKDRIRAWQRRNPASPAAGIAEALMWRVWAGDLRGTGFDRPRFNVQGANPKGQVLFKTYMQKAYQALQAHKPAAAVNPYWYEIMLRVQGELYRPRAELEKTYREGIARYPWYEPIHSAMILGLAWNEDHSPLAIAGFIEKAAERNNRLYARLWQDWDKAESQHGNLFEDTPVNWPRMRNGLSEGLTLPAPERLQGFDGLPYVRLASYACRARDWPTYRLARAGSVIGGRFESEWRQSYSEDICNRFAENAPNEPAPVPVEKT